MGKRKLAMADVTENVVENDEVPEDFQTPQEAAAAAKAGQQDVNPEPDPQLQDSSEAEEQTEQEPDTNSPAVQKAKREYLKKVAKCGAERGAGGKALVTFAKTVVEGAQDKVLVPADAKALYESFKRGAEKAGTLAEAPGVVPDADIAFGESSTKDTKNKSFDVQVSKLKRFIKFGNGFADDAGDIIAIGIATHIGMLADKVENIKYKSTYAALGELVGEQMKDDRRGVAMTSDEMYDFFLGKEPKAKTGLDLVKAALDTCNRALKGKPTTDNQEGRDPVSSANLEAARDYLRETINELDPSGKTLSDIDAKEKKAQEKSMVAQFRSVLRNPTTITTEYRLIKGEYSEE